MGPLISARRLTTLPRRMSKKQIVRLVKERYRTEQVYEELNIHAE